MKKHFAILAVMAAALTACEKSTLETESTVMNPANVNDPQQVTLTLTAPDGRELRTLAWFPTPECRRDFYEKAAKRGLTVTEDNSC